VQHEDDQTLSAVPLPAEPDRRYAFLVCIDGPQFGEIFALERGRELIVGRWSGADVGLLDDGVSRRHALLVASLDGARVTDLASQNGTWVDGQRIQSAALTDGSRLTLGAHTTLKFVHADAQEARYQLRLAEAPLVDPITGLPHSRFLRERLEAELSAAHRYERPVSVLAVGVDDMRGLIQRRGHQVGVEAQRMVAFALEATLRKEDQAASFGGGRFLVVAREADPQGILALARRIQAAVAQASFQTSTLGRPVTVSVGVVTLPSVPVRAQELKARQLMDAAWKVLALAARFGPGQIESGALPPSRK
jgi:diguanylate cyclase (GGDEF)-like protein